jgi:signal transduction histidine kinase
LSTPHRAHDHPRSSADDALQGSALILMGARGRDALRPAMSTLGSYGPRTLWASDWPDALSQVESEKVAAIVVDPELPDVPALPGALAQLRKAAPATAVLVLGAPDGHATVDAWIGADDPPRAIADCIAGAVERQLLRARLQRVEAALEQSEARFRNVIDRVADGVVIVDDDGRVRLVNPAAEQLFGRPRGDLVGEDFGFAVVGGETMEIDVRRRGQTEPVVAELRASETTWAGEPAQVVSLRDITDRKHAEERAKRLLLESAARQEAEKAGQRASFLAEASAAFDSSLDPDTTLARLATLVVPRMADWCVIDLVEGERIRRAAGAHADPSKNALLEELGASYPPARGTPHPAARVIESGKAERHTGLRPDRIRSLAADDRHAELLTALGARSSMTLPFLAQGRTLGAITFVCSERDFDDADFALAGEIALRAATAIENARLYGEAQAASRAKSDFLAVISHELRTPLNAVLGYTQILLDGIAGPLGEQQSRYLESIRGSAGLLLELIDEILAHAQIEAGSERARPRRARLGALVDQMVESGEPMAAERDLELKVAVTDPDAELFTDTEKVRRIVLNLVSNAAKFTDAGSITLEAGTEGDYLVLTVADTGPGIAAEEIGKIFDDFWVSDRPLQREAGGTGLGLSIARRLAELLGGSLSVRSERGVGSVFTLRVPARMEAERGAAGPADG